MRPTVAYWGLPGTGKTTSLVKDVQRSLDDGVPVSEICVSTFRRSMAAEIVERLSRRVNKKEADYIGTTHSICYHLLGLTRDRVVTEEHRKALCESMNLPYAAGLPDDGNVETPLGNLLFSVREYCNHTLRDPRDDWTTVPLLGSDRSRLSDGLVRRFNDAYEEMKRYDGLYDYDDMLLHCLQAQLAPPAQVLVEDEFQDKTPLQVRLYEMWREQAAQVYIGGDVFQALYQYAGAQPELFQNELDAAESKKVLETCHRFGPDLWESSVRVLESAGYAVPRVNPVGFTEVERLSFNAFAQRALAIKEGTVLYLTRTNYIGRTVVAPELVRAGIPYSIKGSVGWPQSLVDLGNAVVRIRRAFRQTEHMGLGSLNFSLAWPQARALADALPAECFSVPKRQVVNHIEMGARGWLETKITPEFKRVLTAQTPYDHMLRGAFGSTPTAIEENRQKIVRYWSQFGERDIAVKGEISTIHAAKGREADYVFLFLQTSPRIDMNSPEVRRDEARTWFVAMTRCKRKLYLVDTMSPFRPRGLAIAG